MFKKREISNGAKKVFFIIALSLLLIVFFIPAPASAGMVTCGLSVDDPTQAGDQTVPCTLCLFFAMIDNWLDALLLFVIPTIAALMIAIGGVYYLLSQGSPEKLAKAKAVFTAVVIGLFIAYGAWLIINFFLMSLGVVHWDRIGGEWWTLDCPTSTSSTIPPVTTQVTPPVTTTPTVTQPVLPVVNPNPYGVLLASSCIDSGYNLEITVSVSNPTNVSFIDNPREYEIVLLGSSITDVLSIKRVFVPINETAEETFSVNVSGITDYGVALYETFNGVRFINPATPATPATAAPAIDEQSFSLSTTSFCP